METDRPRTLWSRERARTELLHAGIPGRRVRGVCTLAIDGGTQIVSWDDRSMVTRWDTDGNVIASYQAYVTQCRGVTGLMIDGTPSLAWLGSNGDLHVVRADSGDRSAVLKFPGVRDWLTTVSVAGRDCLVAMDEGGGSSQTEVVVIDPVTGAVVGRTPGRLARPVLVDGRSLVVVVRDGRTLQLWDPETDRLSASVEMAIDDVILAICPLAPRAFGDSGRTFAAVNTIDWLAVVDLETGAVAARIEFLFGQSELETLVENGRCLVAAAGSTGAHSAMWDPADTADLRWLSGHTRRITGTAVVDVDGIDHLVTGSDDETIMMWNPANARPMRLEDHRWWPWQGMFHAEINDRTCLTVGLADGTASVWDTDGDEEVWSSGPEVPPGVETAADPNAWLFRVPSLLHGSREASCQPRVACFPADGRSLVVRFSTTERDLQIWDPSDDHLLASRPVNWVRSLCTVEVDGRWWVVANEGGALSCWDPLADVVVHRMPLDDDFVRLWPIDIGDRAVVAVEKFQQVMLWSPASDSVVFRDEPRGRTTDLCVVAGRLDAGSGESKEPTTMVSSVADHRMIDLWDPVTGDDISPNGVEGLQCRYPVQAVCAMHSGDRWFVAAGGRSRTVEVLRLESGQPVLDIPTRSEVTALVARDNQLVIGTRTGIEVVALPPLGEDTGGVVG